MLAIDAKFPLEAFTAVQSGARARRRARRRRQRVRADVGKHVKDIAERYLIPGETQDIALMFVPSESIYSDLVEHFDDVVQKAHRGRVVIVSPSLMMMAIQVTQAILRDARMRESAHAIHAEVGKLLNDVRLLAERAAKLEGAFPPGAGGRRPDRDFGRKSHPPRRPHRRDGVRRGGGGKGRGAAEPAAGEGRGVGGLARGVSAAALCLDEYTQNVYTKVFEWDENRAPEEHREQKISIS